jgi:hypothetical protein
MASPNKIFQQREPFILRELPAIRKKIQVALFVLGESNTSGVLQ